MVGRLGALLKIGSDFGGMKLEVTSFLYNTLVTAIAAYALPLAGIDSKAVKTLESEQAQYALRILRLPKQTPEKFATAECNLMTYRLRTIKLTLLLYHRTANNQTDHLTREMLGWVVSEAKGSAIQNCGRMLQEIGAPTCATQFLAMKKRDAKIMVKQKIVMTLMNTRELIEASNREDVGLYAWARREFGRATSA